MRELVGCLLIHDVLMIAPIPLPDYILIGYTDLCQIWRPSYPPIYNLYVHADAP